MTEHVHRRTQRRARRLVLGIALLAVVIAIPLIVFGQLRLDLGYRFGLVPGGDVEQIAGAANGMTLIVVPFKADDDAARDPYRNRARFLATRTASGTDLRDLESDRTITIPVQSLDFIAASDDGRYVFFREGTALRPVHAALVDTAQGMAQALPAGAAVPDIPGDWTTPTWQKSAGRCGPRSVTGIYIACLPRPSFASYLIGDWQLDINIYGDYRRTQAIFRGVGFLPGVGFNADDSAVYFQNERGIWRADIDPDGFGS